MRCLMGSQWSDISNGVNAQNTFYERSAELGRRKGVAIAAAAVVIEAKIA